jgi:hypothetical protein
MPRSQESKTRWRWLSLSVFVLVACDPNAPERGADVDSPDILPGLGDSLTEPVFPAADGADVALSAKPSEGLAAENLGYNIPALDSVESWREWLADSSSELAIASITEFLRSGRDLPTGQEFAAGEAQHVHSSLRALLLDELARLDPEVAAQVSRQLLEGAESLAVDVHAMALRNVAAVAGEPLTAAERDYFRGAWEAIAARPEVLDGSCPVSLAALDLVVFLGDGGLLGSLFDLRQRAVSPLAAEAIERVTERLVSRVPTAVMAQLASTRESFGELPELRARYLARADLAHATEREAVRTFLTDSRMEDDALQAFLLRYPNEDEILVPGLFDAGHESLLEETTRNHDLALQVVQAWRSEPAMAGAEEALSVMQLRLEDLLEDPAAPPSE